MALQRAVSVDDDLIAVTYLRSLWESLQVALSKRRRLTNNNYTNRTSRQIVTLTPMHELIAGLLRTVGS